MIVPDLKERIDSISPGGGSFGIEGSASATMSYVVDGPLGPTGKVDAFLQTVFPYASLDNTGKYVNRVMPMCHPYYRWLYASNISSIKGIGLKRTSNKMDKVLTNAGVSYQKVPEYYGAYDKYEITLNFTPLPYFVLNDSAISTSNVVAYKDDGSQVTINAVKKEYMRNVSYSTSVAAEYLTIKAGEYSFLSDDAEVNKKGFPGFSGKTLVPKTVFNMTWHMVPYNFVFPTLNQSKNIYNALGRVNQNSFVGFEPGQLLFTGVESKPYPRNFFGGDFNVANPITAGWGITDFLYSDIIFKLLYIGFKTSYPIERSPYNQSYIYKGHNLAQFISKQKYFPIVTQTATTIADNKRFKPIYDSYPFELMFYGEPFNMF
jgi:hypothetical protein